MLQDAQDDLQRVSGNSAYYSRSHDLLDNRHQILDRDWQVCTQNIAKGATVSESDTLTSAVVQAERKLPPEQILLRGRKHRAARAYPDTETTAAPCEDGSRQASSACH